MIKFFKKAFADMKQSAKAQHEVDKANFEATKAESKAQFAEAKAMGKAGSREALLQQQRDEQIANAQTRKADAQARLDKANSLMSQAQAQKEAEKQAKQEAKIDVSQYILDHAIEVANINNK